MGRGGQADRQGWPAELQELSRELDRERTAHAGTRRELERTRSRADDLANDVARRIDERRAMGHWIVDLRRALTTVVGVGETLAAHRDRLPLATVRILFDQLRERSQQVIELLDLLDDVAVHPGDEEDER